MILAWAATAWGQGLQEQAERMMNLGFDLAEVEDRVNRKAPAAAPAAMAPDPYGNGWAAPDVPAPERLPLEPNSVLRSVSVHRDRALVTRYRDLELAAGAAQVTFEGLPWSLVSEGLTASVERGGARIVAVEVVSADRRVAEDDAALEGVRRGAEELVGRLGEVRDRMEALLAQREYLRTALVPPAATSGQSVAQVRAGLDFVAERERAIARDLREQQDAAEDLAEDLHPLLVKLEDPLAAGQPVRVELQVEKGGPVRVALQYTVPGAGWVPTYNARLDPATSRVELEIGGIVTQRTGEDWLDAEILLSTADPVGHGVVPELSPWTLGRSGGAGVYDPLTEGVGAVTAAPPIPASGGVVDSRLDAAVEGGGAVVLAIPGKRTLRGDGSPQRLPVAVQQLQATVELATVPKLAPEVLRRASVRYDGALPLLPGQASSFVGRDYVGAGAIEAVIPGETLALAFGADDRFRVTRQLVTRQSEQVRKATRYTFRFRTTVANHGEAAATVLLTDQVPLTEDAGIEVKVLDLGGGARDEQDGAVRWSLDVPAHGEATVELAFSVTVPEELSYVAADLQNLL